jgi:hypothetical protein
MLAGWLTYRRALAKHGNDLIGRCVFGFAGAARGFR